ncbi:MAG: sulfatase [Lentisphaerae bacterium]|nr:sulfatase [Lentisphaerota bacterium]
MKAIMVMFDSLNRHRLASYGCAWVRTPNFRRLAEKTLTFDNAYVGSMPCMPARREIHTGRYNFLHRSWGPIEPFDDSMPEILKENGVYSHLISDHYHYWQEGGANYHTRYCSWEISRGQEGDPWKGVVGKFDAPENLNSQDTGWWHRQDGVNRTYMPTVKEQPQAVTFALGLEFLERNRAEDNWFLQIETFDPHEPYFTHQKYKDLYPHEYKGPLWDWPPYRQVQETRAAVQHMQYENAALVSMCDEHLGQVLDFMDQHDLWKDTLLIVNTDHGFLLGEHAWWGKCVMPFYNEIARMPLFIWDPRCGRKNERRQALVQTIDLPATLLEFFGISLPRDMDGVPLRSTCAADQPVREAGLFGLHGAQVNVTDGRYVYMRSAVTKDNTPLYEYTLMPTHMGRTFSPQELSDIRLAEPFAFTKGCRTMRIAGHAWVNSCQFGHTLFDLEKDPGQEHPLNDPGTEARMIEHLVRLMRKNDAPSEQFERLGLK